MDAQVKSRVVQTAQNLPFEVVALVLQGGGALGAYQAGVYEALSEAGVEPNWIAGISIGAVNAAIIAGNPPDTRVDRLREFWTQVTADGPWSGAGNHCVGLARGDAMRQFLNQMSANFAIASGARGFFKARPVPPLFHQRARSRLRASMTPASSSARWSGWSISIASTLPMRPASALAR
jgi:NTE family protein